MASTKREDTGSSSRETGTTETSINPCQVSSNTVKTPDNQPQPEPAESMSSRSISKSLQQASIHDKEKESPPTGADDILEWFADMIVRYKFLGRKSHIGYTNVKQAVDARLYHLGWSTQKHLFTGSRFEGMPLEVCGDWDWMVIKRHYPVVQQELPPSPTEFPHPGFLIAQPNTQQPAFLRLKATHENQLDDVIKSITDSDGFLLTSGFVAANLVQGDEIHGPASTGVVSRVQPSLGERDSVPCLFSPSWPPCSLDYFSRQRASWPCDQVLCDIRRSGCHLVGVGHPTTVDRDKEWRWSFSIAERKLINDMHLIFAACMFALKAVKKEIWHPDLTENPSPPTAFCSYFVKTACLWVSECDEARGLLLFMPACRVVLDWLIAGYQNRYLPHYFIPKQNLIGHLQPDLCRQVTRSLIEVKDNLWRLALSNMILDGPMSVALKLLCEKLSVSPEVNFTELISVLPVHKLAKEGLSSTIRLLRPGQIIHKVTTRRSVWVPSSFKSLWRQISVQIKMKTPLRDVMTIPENTLLPIMDELQGLISPEYVDFYRKMMYRCMAELYSALIVYCYDSNTPVSDIRHYVDKPVQYYKMSKNIVYVDGFSDRDIAANVHLAKHYYLSGNWEELDSILPVLESLLQEAVGSVEILLCMPKIFVHPHNPLCRALWRGDQLLFREVIQQWHEEFLLLCPMAFGLYILARSSIRNKEPVGIARALVGMEWCLKSTAEAAERESTSLLIKLVNMSAQKDGERLNTICDA